ncbi:hypothetical protein TWF730_011135 [Orbilia blumenaviensis]|uniref:Uncharacterized protein n=1 Tax=Orbilia blumenaviensis TaxID=1796055 RepID=A0AAV9ULR6_9PEZI
MSAQHHDIGYRQLFWTKVEGKGSNIRRRIMPRVFVGGTWPSDICNGSLGIFDRTEPGKESNYLKNLLTATIKGTTIGWGCTPQKWTLIGN